MRKKFPGEVFANGNIPEKRLECLFVQRKLLEDSTRIFFKKW